MGGERDGDGRRVRKAAWSVARSNTLIRACAYRFRAGAPTGTGRQGRQGRQGRAGRAGGARDISKRAGSGSLQPEAPQVLGSTPQCAPTAGPASGQPASGQPACTLDADGRASERASDEPGTSDRAAAAAAPATKPKHKPTHKHRSLAAALQPCFPAAAAAAAAFCWSLQSAPSMQCQPVPIPVPVPVPVPVARPAQLKRPHAPHPRREPNVEKDRAPG